MTSVVEHVEVEPPLMPPHRLVEGHPHQPVYVGGFFTLKPANELPTDPYEAVFSAPHFALTRCWLCETLDCVDPDDLLGLCGRCITWLREDDERQTNRARIYRGERTRHGLRYSSPTARSIGEDEAA